MASHTKDRFMKILNLHRISNDRAQELNQARGERIKQKRHAPTRLGKHLTGQPNLPKIHHLKTLSEVQRMVSCTVLFRLPPEA